MRTRHVRALTLLVHLTIAAFLSVPLVAYSGAIGDPVNPLSPLLPVQVSVSALPWYDVPVEYGFSGPYACVTQNQPFRGPVITCNPSALAQMSTGAQVFLIAHEHGHVYQMRNGLVFYPANQEADADCYAAKYLAANNPAALTDALSWLQNVLGPGGGDLIHGTGFQIAALARQCAGW